MKKSLVALAILAAAGVASAQSSVTMFGIVTIGLQHGTGDGVGSSDKSGINSGGDVTSRLGFRGTEDLGGGMSAGFWLEGQLNVDNGSGAPTGTNNQVGGITGGGGLTFNRRSTVSLASKSLGEVRLGRDYRVESVNNSAFDPFTVQGAGGSEGPDGQANRFLPGGGTALRVSNSVSYFLPKLGGFYGQFQHSLGENANNVGVTEDDGDHTGIRLGWANGPINVAVSTGKTDFARSATTGDVTLSNVAGSYDFGFAKLAAVFNHDKFDQAVELTGKGLLIGATVPMGAGEIRAAYSRYEITGNGLSPEIKKVSLGYRHHLSKRTALYATVGHLKNSGGSSRALLGATTGVNENSTGSEFGITHRF
ncbi:porin [Polaromonas sp.]|uniref:porin n=1 Tax=Polaromonas sp. TaxID=1869339 RepID=UPI00356B5902